MVVVLFCSSACAPTPNKETAAPRTWSFADATVFPADRSLVRPEDGVVLPDGTLLVADQAHGLIVLSPDGTTKPFGEFAAAGYVHEPPDRKAGPNGVAFESTRGRRVHLLSSNLIGYGQPPTVNFELHGP